jgi:putative transposase
MSGKGRSIDNAYVERLWRTLKYEWLIIYGFDTVSALRQQIDRFLHWYHDERPHQSLDYQTPMKVLKKHKKATVVENVENVSVYTQFTTHNKHHHL